VTSTHVRDFPLPDVGEGLTEAEIVNWRVAVGDVVEVNQPIVDIETAKAVVELPCPFSGTVSALLVAEGRVVPVGTPIMSVEVSSPTEPVTEGEAREAVLVGYGVAHGATRKRHLRARSHAPAAAPTPVAMSTGRPLAKPPVRFLARELGIDLAAVTPSGPHGDITRDDVQRAAAAPGPVASTRVLPTVAPPVRGERIPVRGVRRAMAEAMVRSVSTAPHVTEWLDVDVSGTVRLVEQMREHPAFAGLKPTPLTVVAAAMVNAVTRTPIINSSWIDLPDGSSEIEVYSHVNLGIAVASDRGLVVPNVRDAGSLSLSGLARALGELTQRARRGELTPADSVEGTITVTNVGVFGVDGGTPILVPGEAAILATGRIMDRPWVSNGGLCVRPVMQLSLTFDHRIVDGAAGSTFLSDVATFLESPTVALA